MSAELNNIQRDRYYKFNVEQHKATLLFGILFLGLSLRLIFTYALADDLHYYHSTYEFPDTKSFTEGFINFWERGNYTHSGNHPEASFGRLPGYPVFYGIHYVLFGKELSLPATAITQLLLDVCAIWILYRIVKKISGSEKTALLGALVYSCYPFTIYWTPYICTESLSCFVTLLWIHQLCYFNKNKLHLFLTGLICAAALFIREYLGILIALTLLTQLIYFRRDIKVLFRNCSLITAGFLVLYIGWPIRNYYQFEKIILVRPSSAGYANYSNDMVGYTLFYHCWSQNDNEWYDSLLTGHNTIFPKEAFTNNHDEVLAENLITKMQTCGTSYDTWIYNIPYPKRANCNEEIYNGFVYLRDEYIKAHPFTYFIKVPLLNLKKAFFKMKPEQAQNSFNWIYYLAFSYRSIMIIAGFAGILYLKQYRLLLPVFLFSVFMYIYICAFHRSLEMRYILQADVLLLIPAIIVLTKLYAKFFPSQQAS